MKKRIAATLAIAFVVALSACTQADVKPPPTAADSTLYRRLGGYDAIAAVTDSFLARIQGDTAISIFFAGLDPTQVNRVRQMVVDQLCAASGGPCRYVGRSMKEAHATLNISSDAFDKFIAHLEATLISFKVGERERAEVLGTLRSLKGDVVTQ
jgi:hemoglobin